MSAGTWIDSTVMVVCRFVDSKVEKATMSEGPNALIRNQKKGEVPALPDKPEEQPPRIEPNDPAVNQV